MIRCRAGALVQSYRGGSKQVQSTCRGSDEVQTRCRAGLVVQKYSGAEMEIW